MASKVKVTSLPLSNRIGDIPARTRCSHGQPRGFSAHRQISGPPQKTCFRRLNASRLTSNGLGFRQRAILERREDSCGPDEEPNCEEGFDLATAVALAGCSFEAYLEPKGRSALTTTSETGVNTTYTDRGFLETKYDGFLEVNVKRASDLPANDLLGKSDPYVLLSLDGSCARTKTLQRDLNPVWDETFLLLVRDAEKDILRARVRDADLLRSDDDLGYTMYPVKAIKEKGALELETELQRGGMLSLSARFLPIEDDTFEKCNVTKGAEWADLETTLEDSPLLKPWTDLAVLAGKTADQRFDPVCFVENVKTDTQAWVYQSDARNKEKEVVIAFRGTEQSKLKDLGTDLNVQPAAFDPENTDNLTIVTNKLFTNFAHEKLVHKGFLDSYISVRSSIFDALDAIVGSDDRWTVYVTGHSLGGALATLCAFELASRRSFRSEVQMYNIGSPRVGNATFAKDFKEIVPKSWRIVNEKDAVVTVPRLMGYRHVDTQVILDVNGIMKFSEEAPRDTNVFGSWIQDFKDDGHRSLLGFMDEAISDLSDGLAEHMEDEYFKRFYQCVQNSDLF